MPSIPLSDIASHLKLPAPSANPAITNLNSLHDAAPTELSFISSDAYLKALLATQAAAVLVHKRVKLPANFPKPTLIVDDADLAVAQVLALFAAPVPHPPVGIDPTARIAPSARIDATARIGPYVTVGDRSTIGPNCSIHAGVAISCDVSIGADCQFFPNVTIRERITIGNRVIIHANSALGTDGFGYRWNGREHFKIPQIGTIIIEDDVEIGSCVCIDRAKFSMTKIGRGTKIDNLVQIAHNCIVGPHCLITGQAGLAGSVTLGTGVVLGGNCAVVDHTTIGDGGMVAGGSGVAQDVEPKQIVSGLPAIPHRQNLREQAALRKLPELLTQVRKLEHEIEELKKSLPPR